MLGRDSGRAEGAALGAAHSSVSTLAVNIGTRMARLVFEKRGNHSEAHLCEAELATICAAAAEAMLVRTHGSSLP